MSGIAGILHLDGRPVDRAALTRMTDALIHRGPDGTGHWVNGSIGLGQRMLHTTPESLNEKQPLFDEPSGLCLVFDGRVDNREELSAALEAKGAKPRTDTDAELVLRAYECWGEECPAKIIGDFAFALWDVRARKLFCARDPMGMRTFYYHTDGRTFIFASEMQPLFEVPSLRREPNLPLIGMYLLWQFNEQEETLYENVLRLPPAHSLTLRSGSPLKSRYWDIDPEYVIRYRTDEQYAEHFLHLFRESVRCRLRSAGPVGALLSGGLDSSSIVSTAQHLFAEKVIPGNGFETFSIIFDEHPCDERRYIDEVVRHWGVKANYLVQEKNRAWVNFDQTARYPDVLYETVLFMLTPAFTDMKQRGMKVLLDGIGGDELFAAGFEHLTDLMRQGQFSRLLWQLNHDARIYEVSKRWLLVNYCLKQLFPKSVKNVLRPFVNSRQRRPHDRLVRSEFIKSNLLEQRLNSSIMVPKFPTRSQQVIYNGLFFGWNPVMAAEMNGLLAARFSLEIRRPFFDRRLVEFMLAVPETQRWQGAAPKHVMRQAMKGILPEKIRCREKKTEYSPPLDFELRHRQAVEVEKLFRTSVLASLGVVETEELLRIYENYRAGSQQYLTGIVELTVGLELWCRSIVGTPTKYKYKEKVA